MAQNAKPQEPYLMCATKHKGIQQVLLGGSDFPGIGPALKFIMSGGLDSDVLYHGVPATVVYSDRRSIDRRLCDPRLLGDLRFLGA